MKKAEKGSPKKSIPEKSSLDDVIRGQVFRIVLIGVLIILLQIPISMIRGVVSERQARRLEAAGEITSKWGKKQNIIGPILTIPYLEKVSQTVGYGTTQIQTKTRYAHFLPDDLQITGTIDSEVRYRGIFKVPVYRLSINSTGQFPRLDFSEWGIDLRDVVWEQAHLMVRISDARAITNQAFLTWNKDKIEFLPGVGEYGGNNTGIHVPLKGHLLEGPSKFSYQLELNGSEGVYFAPFGGNSTVDMKSNWTDPSFQGNWLPSERSINGKGFKAKWDIPLIGRSYPRKWISEHNVENAIFSSLFGVDLIIPVDQYRMSQRSIKYVILFLTLTFATLWLFEILIKVRIHIIQYLLVGVGMCLFYLLELSLSEHLSFFIAYICASLAVVLLVFAYCIAVLKSIKRAAITGGVVTLLYGYLYVLLMNQDYALLIGSVGLFLVLATVMYLTRKVDWYSLKS
jgi:inner membrane protein